MTEGGVSRSLPLEAGLQVADKPAPSGSAQWPLAWHDKRHEAG